MNKIPPLAFPTLAVGTIGVVGELILLRHELVNCYPFKMLTYPPGRFYHQLGNVGSVVVFCVTILLAIVVAQKAPLLIPSVTTVVAPLLYLAIVVTMTSALYGWTVPPETRNFDGYGIGEATADFARTAGGLAIAGLIIGAVSSGILRTATRRKKIKPATA